MNLQKGTLRADIVVNAAGPHVVDIPAMLGGCLPLSNVFHQKIAFADAEVVIDRRMPFSIDLDGQNVASGILTYDVLVHTITSLAARNFPYTTPTETTIAVFRT